jgi:hypothetical protein
VRTDTWRRASQTLRPSMHVSNICLTDLPLKDGVGSAAKAVAKLSMRSPRALTVYPVTTPFYPFSYSTFNR